MYRQIVRTEKKNWQNSKQFQTRFKLQYLLYPMDINIVFPLDKIIIINNMAPTLEKRYMSK
jgi:hypothetical protein